MTNIKPALGQQIRAATHAKRTVPGPTWPPRSIRIRCGAVAALLGQHPLSAQDASTIVSLLGLDDPDAGLILQMQPYRGADPAVISDPTIYRFHEALTVYGPALKRADSRAVRRRNHERNQLSGQR